MTFEANSEGLLPGSVAPDFDLVATDGTRHSLPAPGEVAATVLVWTCNHCPYAIGWHERLLAVASELRDSDVRFYFINSNDADRYPADSLESMRRRVETDGGWPAPYLFDETQEVARAYGPATTPDVYVIGPNRNIVYRGAPDDDYLDESKNAAWLRGAVHAVMAGDTPALDRTKPVGCSIKWKTP